MLILEGRITLTAFKASFDVHAGHLLQLLICSFCFHEISPESWQINHWNERGQVAPLEIQSIAANQMGFK